MAGLNIVPCFENMGESVTQQFDEIVQGLPGQGFGVHPINVGNLFSWLLVHCVDPEKWDVIAEQALMCARYSGKRAN